MKWVSLKDVIRIRATGDVYRPFREMEFNPFYSFSVIQTETWSRNDRVSWNPSRFPSSFETPLTRFIPRWRWWKKIMIETPNDICAVAYPTAAIVKRERGSRAMKNRACCFRSAFDSFCRPYRRNYTNTNGQAICIHVMTITSFILRKQGGDGHSGPFYPRCTRTKRKKFSGGNLRRWERRAQDAA